MVELIPRWSRRRPRSEPSTGCISDPLDRFRALVADSRACCPNAGARTFLSAATFEQPISLEFRLNGRTKGDSFPSILCLGNTPSTCTLGALLDGDASKVIPVGDPVEVHGCYRVILPRAASNFDVTVERVHERRCAIKNQVIIPP
jgi:hypothetical protein